MELEKIIVFLFLVIISVWDIKERAVPQGIFMLGILVAILLNFYFENGISTEKLLGMVMGLVLIAVSRFTKGQIGEGDGAAFLVTGLALGVADNFLLLFEALFLSFVWSLFLLIGKRIRLNTKMPFLPFVLISFILCFAGR